MPPDSVPTESLAFCPFCLLRSVSHFTVLPLGPENLSAALPLNATYNELSHILLTMIESVYTIACFADISMAYADSGTKDEARTAAKGSGNGIRSKYRNID